MQPPAMYRGEKDADILCDQDVVILQWIGDKI